MTIMVNGREILTPSEKHDELYKVARALQALVRAIKTETIQHVSGTGASLTHTEKYIAFNEAMYAFTEKER